MHSTDILALSSQIDLFEQDALEVLHHVRSMKNKFAPISRIPAAVLCLIPKYLERQFTETDADMITLTHMCRSWRRLFISRPSLWTRLDFTNVDKTRTYIKRSNQLPLETLAHGGDGRASTEGAFLLAIPHIRRFESLTIGQSSGSLRNLSKYLTPPVPFLKQLTMDFTCGPAPSIDSVWVFRGTSPRCAH
jgi:hypothetical protein